MTRRTLPRPHTRYHHEAYFWRGLDDFLERTVGFVLEGLELDMAVMVAVPHERWRPLRAALGPAADQVAYADMARLGRNPARIIPAWRAFVDEHAPDGTALRGVAEPVWAGRRAAEIAECQVHESLMNLAIPAAAPLWLLCPYDAGSLAPEVLAEVERTHPVVGHGAEAVSSPTYVPTEPGTALLRPELDAPPTWAEVLEFGDSDLTGVRKAVRRAARAAGLDPGRTDDLVLAVNEVAANSLDHGGGSGVMHLWRGIDELVVEVHDRGRFTDPLAGRIDPAPGQVRGRGLWIANRLADLVQIRPQPTGTVVRVSTWL
ncbi:sensor histidine kinase [Cellulomonas sp. APG4]|uniref:anti-sigma factor RsbA family regulatory protein n=1 Tax=Cellulomonas sp. APG4 TaxID=1538656 RepID=UPI00137B2276|nr:anti-sigma factor RsbA family regulatory protein [Cellulomonas sp. APG4]NCT92695.1 sensor histidine kinase [Cellulomonas sp. APG4]